MFYRCSRPGAHQTTQLQKLISSLTISHGISQCSQPCGLGTATGDFALSLVPRGEEKGDGRCSLFLLCVPGVP